MTCEYLRWDGVCNKAPKPGRVISSNGIIIKDWTPGVPTKVTHLLRQFTTGEKYGCGASGNPTEQANCDQYKPKTTPDSGPSSFLRNLLGNK